MSLVIRFDGGHYRHQRCWWQSIQSEALGCLRLHGPAWFTIATSAHGEFLRSGNVARAIHELLVVKRKVFLEIGQRMAELGLLDAADDFWFLARHELYDYLNGKRSGALVGIATSYDVATGVSRIVPQLDQIGRVQNGGILVCNSTDPEWMSVFPKICGLVLETGGMLTYDACLSCEYGIPAVRVGDAMRQVPDATAINVDGNAAAVYPVLSI